MRYLLCVQVASITTTAITVNMDLSEVSGHFAGSRVHCSFRLGFAPAFPG